MTTHTPLPAPLRQLIKGFEALLEQHAVEPVVLEQGAALLRALLASDDWLPPDATWPDPQHYCQYLLYRDPQARFSVVSFVWGPGQSTPIHDHTVWGLVGLLRGAEIAQAFTRGADGALVKVGPPRRLEAGQVTAVSPAIGDIHQVANAFDDRVSIGIHIYGADIGAVDRSVFTPEGVARPFRSGYANQLP